MNILVINWQDWKNPAAGGAELNMYEIFSRLIKKGHNVILLCSRGKGQPRYSKLDGFEIYRLGKRHNFNFFVPSALRALLRHKVIDIIVDDLNKIPFYSPFFTKKKVIAYVHHLFLKTIFKETIFPFALYVFLTENLIPYFYPRNQFVAVSKSTAQELRNLGVKQNIHIVYNAIPDIPKNISVPRVKNLVCYVGRVKMYKSIEHFIRAVAIIREKREIEAMVVGEGDAKDYLISFARKLNVPIKFTGYVNEEEKFRIYLRARVIVQPSIKEGFGLTVIEAQACGTPAVCADSPGLRETIIDGKTGFLYPYGDIETFAQKVIELLEDDEKWQRFSNNAKEWAKNFSWDKSAEKLESIIYGELRRQ